MKKFEIKIKQLSESHPPWSSAPTKEFAVLVNNKEISTFATKEDVNDTTLMLSLASEAVNKVAWVNALGK